MSDFLLAMAKSSAARAARADPDLRTADFIKPVVTLALTGFDIIAEIKDRSPAAGELAAAGTGRSERARQYVAGGAVAISVLTEPSRFAGALEHLEEVVAAAPDTPVMRKDFLVDPIQVLEARQAGASGILLIAAMLDDGQLQDMLACAWEHEMFVLLESFDESDLARSAVLLGMAEHRDKANTGQLLIGVNTRNLRSLDVDNGRLEKFSPLLPVASCVAESGVCSADDAAQVAELGYRLALVGTALMRSGDPAMLVAAMREAGSASIAA